MRRTLFLIGLCFLAVQFAAPAGAANRAKGAFKPQISVTAPAKPAVADNSAPMKATPAMWLVHGPKGVAYMLGSVHALPKNIDWQTAQITAAMKRADTFVFELPMDDGSRAAAVARFRKEGLMPFSMALPSLFDEEMREDYRDVIFLTHADPTAIVYMRPWLAAMVLQGVADGTTGLMPAEGVDNKIYGEVKGRKGVHFGAFETADQQLRLLMGDGNLTEEVATLRQTFKKILAEHGKGENADALVNAWAAGDTKALAAFGPESKTMPADVKKAFLENRNRAWVPQITAMLNQRHTYFITVGAAHLIGKTGVPNLLRAEGYQVDGP